MKLRTGADSFMSDVSKGKFEAKKNHTSQIETCMRSGSFLIANSELRIPSALRFNHSLCHHHESDAPPNASNTLGYSKKIPKTQVNTTVVELPRSVEGGMDIAMKSPQPLHRFRTSCNS